MNPAEIENVLREHAEGTISSTDAVERIRNLSYENIGFARVDHGRATRQGFPEVIFGHGKTPEQIAGIFERLIERSPNVLVTRTTPEVFGQIRNIHTEAEWHESAKLVRLFRDN